MGPDNVAVVAIYTMERQEDGAWKIDGCELTPTSDTELLVTLPLKG